MQTQQQLNYQRVEKAINYIRNHFKSQPDLSEIAKATGLSMAHFQKLFSEWAGTSPKKFLQYTSIQYAKSLLKNQQISLFDTAFEVGLSSTSRLHDLFVNIEGMTPADYKNGGVNLCIDYAFAPTPFGQVLVANTQKGICRLVFEEEEARGLANLAQLFPAAQILAKQTVVQQKALQIFSGKADSLSTIKLHLKATHFQLKVWEALLKIPAGRLASYGAVAHRLGKPTASRAIGTAIGQNPIAFLIPCHRVIRASGQYDGYAWGNHRKTVIIGWENAQVYG